MKKFEDEQLNFLGKFFQKMNFNRIKYFILSDYSIYNELYIFFVILQRLTKIDNTINYDPWVLDAGEH